MACLVEVRSDVEGRQTWICFGRMKIQAADLGYVDDILGMSSYCQSALNSYAGLPLAGIPGSELGFILTSAHLFPVTEML